MSKVISISNHKGGVGKTTSALNIGAGLNKLGKKILLVDFDAQADLSQSLGITDAERNIYGALRGAYRLEPSVILPGLDLLPSSLDLSGAELELSGEPGREYILKKLLEPFRARYDYIIIDSPPSLGLLTINAFVAADEIYIPLQAHFLALKRFTKLLDIVEKVKERLNPRLKIGGVFITQYDSRKILNRDVVTAISDFFKEGMLEAKIRDTVALAEAPSLELDIFRYSPGSNGAKDYLSLAQEILSKHNKHSNQ
jgi:chromosome partitioning protein